MNFEEFQNRSRLYVVGALEPEELEEFEQERKKFGKKAEDFVTQCYALHEAFALSLRSAKASAAIKEQLMSMVRVTGRAEREAGCGSRASGSKLIPKLGLRLSRGL
jgi:hypothetical protein